MKDFWGTLVCDQFINLLILPDTPMQQNDASMFDNWQIRAIFAKYFIIIFATNFNFLFKIFLVWEVIKTQNYI